MDKVVDDAGVDASADADVAVDVDVNVEALAQSLQVDYADVVVVGGGAAGLSAAIAACESLATAASATPATPASGPVPAGPGQPQRRVALVSKVYPMRSHTVAAEGGAAGMVARDGDTFDQHIADTLRAGAGLSHEEAVRFVVEAAPGVLARLEQLGMPWTRDSDGRPAVRRFGGMSKPRTWYAADKTGFHMLHTLYQQSLRWTRPAQGASAQQEPVQEGHTQQGQAQGTPAQAAPAPEAPTQGMSAGGASAGDGVGIVAYNEHLVLELIRDASGAARGVVAYNQQQGRLVVIAASAVVLATGGAARAWGTSTNAGIVTGDGLAMALRAGLALRDMEMVQVHPTALAGSGLLLTEAARGEGGVLVDRNADRYLADYGLGPVTEPGQPVPRRMELGPRDQLSQAFWKASRDGRTQETAQGDVVFLDVRHLGRQVLDERLPLVVGLAKRYAGVDAYTQPIPVRPAAHYTMGGIVTTAQGQVVDQAGRAVAGLYAAGECASNGLHGANRLGSNSLVETLVVGVAVGKAVAGVVSAGQGKASGPRACSCQGICSEHGGRTEHGTCGQHGGCVEQRLRVTGARLAQPWLAMRGRGSQSPAQIRRELGAVLDRHVSIYRDAAGLRQASAQLDALAQRYRDVAVADTSAVWNTDWAAAVELGAMLDVARCVVAAALARQESRGAHQRLDFPDSDPVARNSYVSYAQPVSSTVGSGQPGSSQPAGHDRVDNDPASSFPSGIHPELTVAFAEPGHYPVTAVGTASATGQEVAHV